MPSYGTALLYGVSATITSAKVTDFSIDVTPANTAEAMNESGNVIARRYDDNTNEGSISLMFLSDYVLPTAGATLAYDSVTYEVTKVGKRQTQRGFRTLELSIKSSAGITYA
jgi:hypothetical protein